MIRAIIIEDEIKVSELLKQMVGEIDPSIQILAECRDLPTAILNIKKYKPNLVFLDVQLPGYNGLMLYEFLTPDEISFKIIFTTASEDHALKAFDMKAVDYILKPIQYEKLLRAISTFKEVAVKNSKEIVYNESHIAKIPASKIIISSQDRFEIVKVDDILYISAEGSYCKIFLKDDKWLISSHNLKYFDEMLRGNDSLIRIHRSYLVNIHHAMRILRGGQNMLVMNNGAELSISIDKMDKLLSFFNM